MSVVFQRIMQTLESTKLTLVSRFINTTPTSALTARAVTDTTSFKGPNDPSHSNLRAARPPLVGKLWNNPGNVARRAGPQGAEERCDTPGESRTIDAKSLQPKTFRLVRIYPHTVSHLAGEQSIFCTFGDGPDGSGIKAVPA